MARCRNCATPANGFEAKSEVWEDGTGQSLVGGDTCTVIATPGVLVYLNSELSSMGIKLKFRIKE
jgi:DNA-directed RNA polymerase I subunit RPA2